MSARHARVQSTVPSPHQFVSQELAGNWVSVKAGKPSYDIESEFIDRDPINEASFGNSTNYKLDLDEMVHRVVLEVNVSAITLTPGAGSTFQQLAPLNRVIDKIELYAGSTVMQTIRGRDITVGRILFHTQEKELSVAAVADATGLAAQSLYIQIPCFIDQTGGFPLFCLSGDMYFRITYHPLTAAIIDYDGAAPTAITGSIVSSRIKVLVENLSVEEKSRIVADHYAMARSYPVTTDLEQYWDIPIGATTTTKTLSSVLGPVAYGVVSLEDSATGALQQLGTYHFKDSGNNSLHGNSVVNARFNRLLVSMGFEGPDPGLYMVIPFASAPQVTAETGSHTGSHILTGTETAEFTFPATASACTLRIQWKVLSWAVLKQGGLRFII